jgi:hypothetical protein
MKSTSSGGRYFVSSGEVMPQILIFVLIDAVLYECKMDDGKMKNSGGVAKKAAAFGRGSVPWTRFCLTAKLWPAARGDGGAQII